MRRISTPRPASAPCPVTACCGCTAAPAKPPYLELLRDISHAIPQFVSLAGRRLMTWDGVFLPEGFINERVQLSDWEGRETIGEVRNGSCWPEVSMLLTYAEVPGIYADRHSGLVMALDHVDCTAQWRLDGSLALDIHNPPASTPRCASS